LDNVLDFKNQLDSYSNQIKNIEYRITFVINLDNENDAVKRLLPDLKKSIESAKNQINLLLRMYDLKKLTTIRKTK
jgi:peptidoglycan hydrolase CwlO-like protein